MSIDPRTSSISVIIPTLNEADELPCTLTHPLEASGVEVIVADGGSEDGTVRVGASRGAKVLEVPPGRGRQMNAGAAAAGGELLLFLHADTRLPPDFADHVRRILGTPGVAAGAFRLAIEGERRGLRLVEKVANWRSERLQRPYGDQALFMRAEVFQLAGGFPDFPLLEDCALVRSLRRLGRIVIAPAAASTSGRRWLQQGIVRTTLLNQAILFGSLVGCSPRRLARWYRGREKVGNGRFLG
jgi:rSAM/selenodomain-associated transferase 2